MRALIDNVDYLYTFLHNQVNVPGWTVVLKAGTYALDGNKGSLNFLPDMSLIAEEPGKVTIFADDLDGINLKTPDGNRTGAIRMGNGFNSIEGINVENHRDTGLRSLIQTDINLTSTAE